MILTYYLNFSNELAAHVTVFTVYWSMVIMTPYIAYRNHLCDQDSGHHSVNYVFNFSLDILPSGFMVNI